MKHSMNVRGVVGRLVAGASAVAMLLAPMTAMAEENRIEYNGVADGSKGVPVVATYNGTRPGAMIPAKIDFEGKVGNYRVIAYEETAKIDAIDTPITITPSGSFTMTKEGTSDTITATVSQDKTSFGKAEIAAGADGTANMSDGTTTTPVSVKRAFGNGTITANGITTGVWKGTLVFTIG